MQHLGALVLNTLCHVKMNIIWNRLLPPLCLILQNSWRLSLSPVFPASLKVSVKEAPEPTEENTLTTRSDWGTLISCSSRQSSLHLCPTQSLLIALCEVSVSQ